MSADLQAICQILSSSIIDLLASLLGIAGSICFAIPPYFNASQRRALLLIARVQRNVRFAQAGRRAESILTRKLIQDIKRERYFNLAGAISLGTAFILLMIRSAYTGLAG